MSKPVYLYLRHTPKMVKVFASEQVKPIGVPVTLCKGDHELRAAFDHHARNVLNAIKAEFQRTREWPTFQLAHALALKAGTMHGVNYEFVPQKDGYPARVRISKAS